jgi:Uma2 family endonuclease
MSNGPFLIAHFSFHLIQNRYFCFMYPVEKKDKATAAEFFAYLESIEGRAEFFNGEILDMAGGSPNHGLITMNCGIAIGSQLEDGNCAAYSNDLLVGIEFANAYVFPDLTVVCGELELTDTHPQIAKNPQVIVEVLSPSTQDRDRTSKLIRYMQIPSLREYLLVEQSKPQVDVCFINERGFWDSETVVGLDGILKIRSLGMEIPLAKIYRKVNW